LFELTGGKKPFVWTEQANQALKRLKEDLNQIQEGKERVIGYYSHAYTKEERNYCVTRKEMAAIILSVKHFELYLLFKKFVIRTDHHSLRWCLKLKHPESQMAKFPTNFRHGNNVPFGC